MAQGNSQGGTQLSVSAASNTPATDGMSAFILKGSDSPLQYPLCNLKKSKLKIKKKNMGLGDKDIEIYQ